MGKNLEDIKKGLVQEKNKYWDIIEIEKYLRQYNITSDSDLLEILEQLVEDDIWKWLKFIANRLPRIASHNNFLDLLEKVIKKIKGDMAQGPIIKALINIGSRDPILGFELFEKMIHGNTDLIFFASFPLGGAGKTDFQNAFLLFQRAFASNNPNIKATSIRALMVTFEEANKLKKEYEIFQILERASNNNEDIIVQKQAASAYIAFSDFNPDECIRQLIHLVTEAKSDIRFNVAYTLQMQDLTHREDEIAILKICAEDDDEKVLGQVSYALALKGKEFPEESLDIIKDWIKQGKYFKIRDIEFCLQELGKVYLGRCIRLVDNWIEEEEDKKLRYLIPTIFSELCSSDYEQLVEYLKLWEQKSVIFQNIAVKTIRNILTTIYPPNIKQQSLFNSCFNIVKGIAAKRGVNIETAIEGESDEFFRCFILIEECEKDRQDLDFNKIFSNLNNYPTIKHFLGDSWFNSKKKEMNKSHFLLICLSDEDAIKTAFLNHLEKMLKIIIDSNINKLGDFKKGLKTEVQFLPTISEIEVISSFCGHYPVEIAPTINGKKLDAKVQIEGRELLIEVINPDMFKPLKYLRSAMGIPNRARSKVYDEFKKHLKDIPILGNKLVVIFIDIGRSEIDYDFLENYLIGTLQLTMIFNESKKEIGEIYTSRASDSMHDLRGEMDIISAVICYETALRSDKQYHFQGRIIENKYANNPLGNLNDIIMRSFFR